ncbi:cysteine hydrolase family protein [Alicyclobacillus sp. SO9]|uniref:cysteine hydrolase family protein n=1 Tax=Alicyclobacillus sp. SO9 TaxID=2665646 RepID=UPI0018E82F53|nr:isochorismatase family protein [Alicyclobacillus sp. SO9]QQE78845.1 isochorismatase family protein [Alicyclobacillus sp. SO9]
MKTAVLIVDGQVGLVDGMNVHAKDQVLHQIANVLTLAHQAGWEVIYIMDDDIGQGDATQSVIHPKITPAEADVVFHKTSTSAFFRTGLDEYLKSRGVEHVLIAGFKTEVCVDTTCRHAFSLGYHVTLVADAHSTSDRDELSATKIIQYHNANLHGLDNHEFVIEVQPLDDIKRRVVVSSN